MVNHWTLRYLDKRGYPVRIYISADDQSQIFCDFIIYSCSYVVSFMWVCLKTCAPNSTGLLAFVRMYFLGGI